MVVPIASVAPPVPMIDGGGGGGTTLSSVLSNPAVLSRLQELGITGVDAPDIQASLGEEDVAIGGGGIDLTEVTEALTSLQTALAPPIGLLETTTEAIATAIEGKTLTMELIGEPIVQTKPAPNADPTDVKVVNRDTDPVNIKGNVDATVSGQVSASIVGPISVVLNNPSALVRLVDDNRPVVINLGEAG